MCYARSVTMTTPHVRAAVNKATRTIVAIEKSDALLSCTWLLWLTVLSITTELTRKQGRAGN